MSKQEPKNILQNLASTLIDPTNAPSELKNEVGQLFSFLEQFNTLKLDEECGSGSNLCFCLSLAEPTEANNGTTSSSLGQYFDSAQHKSQGTAATHLPQYQECFLNQRFSSGLAIKPASAANCTNDHIRTIQYLRALHASILAIRKTVQHRSLNILYPGSGPFGTLVLPIMSIISPEIAKFTIIDIHQESIDSLKFITRKLGLDKSIQNFEVANAVDYQIPPDSKPDIVILETMLAALKDEPQVAISMNLLKQAPEAVLIPEAIRIDFVMSKPDIEFSPDIPIETKAAQRVHIGHVFNINRESIATWQQQADHLPAAKLKIPSDIEDSYVPLFLTHIQLDDTHAIKCSESGLTQPTSVMHLDGSIKAGSEIQFRYELGKYPRLKGLKVG